MPAPPLIPIGDRSQVVKILTEINEKLENQLRPILDKYINNLKSEKSEALRIIVKYSESRGNLSEGPKEALEWAEKFFQEGTSFRDKQKLENQLFLVISYIEKKIGINLTVSNMMSKSGKGLYDFIQTTDH